MEGGSDRRTGVARGRDDDGQFACRACLLSLQAGREEAGTYVLERGGRAVEKFEDETAGRVQCAQRRRKIQRFGADRREFRREGIAGEKRCEQARGDLRGTLAIREI